MKRFFLLVLLPCILTANCQSIERIPSFSVPIEVVDNRPFVAVKIKGRTFHFVIDTGGFNSIELEAARELKLELRNKFQMPGAGEKTVDAWETDVPNFLIGNNSFTNRRFYVLPLKEIKEGLNLPFLDGIIGYDFFGTSVLQIDYPSKTASFLSEYKGENGVPFSIRGSHVPKLAVEVDGIGSEFVIDTGDRSQLTLGRTFSERVLQGTRYGLSEEKVTGYGLGGPIMARTFELDSIRFGGIEARKILTRVPVVKNGVFAQSDFTGSIGSGLLRSYKVTFDYQNKLFYAE